MSHNSFHEEIGHFLIDTGSQLNLIKRKGIISGLLVNTDVIYNIVGIDQGGLNTFGEVIIEIFGIGVKFQIVNDDFPISGIGILGIPFLEQQQAVLTFKDIMPNSLRVGGQELPLRTGVSVSLPPRMKTLITVPVKNIERQEGYIRRLDTQPGVYIGEVLVSQENGLVRIFAINTNHDSVTLSIPPVELEEFIEIPPSPRSARTGNPNQERSKADAARLVQLTKFLDMQDLSDSEQASILEIVKEFPYQFYLPSDQLNSTTKIQHKIVTTDEIPINTKQYRFPLVHKEQIKKQIDSLLENKIIQPSASPYNSPVWVVPKKPGPDGKPRWRMVTIAN